MYKEKFRLGIEKIMNEPETEEIKKQNKRLKKTAQRMGKQIAMFGEKVIFDVISKHI